MPRVMYIDCFSGAAGDMLLGAFLDAGLPEAALRQALGSLGVGHTLKVGRVLRSGVSATKIEVEAAAEDLDAGQPHAHRHGDQDEPDMVMHTHAEHGHRSLAEIAHLIGHSNLSLSGKRRAVELFRRLAGVEAAIHDMPVEAVHLHEVGALDSIIDIVGCVFAFEWFGVDEVVASPLNVGSGTVSIAHGTFPVPAPATLRLLTGVPVYSEGPTVELVTPTGALLVSGYATRYATMPPMAVERVGYGAGTRDFPSRPNLVRVVLGTTPAASDRVAAGGSEVVQIECEIDDMNPQLFSVASDRLFSAGALDVFLTPVQMKKGRPGTLVTVLAPADRREVLGDVLFRETTTIGVRYWSVERETLERRHVSVETPWGSVRIKVAERGGAVMNAAPEYEDCVKVSGEQGVAVKTVQAEAMRAWLNSNK